MANIDYIQGGKGSFASLLALNADIDQENTLIPFVAFNFSRPDAVQPGMAVMVNDEIMRVEAITLGTLTVKRGCADTIPALHLKNSRAWIFDASTTGSDRKERSAGETIGVKVAPYTIGGGPVPSASITPVAVTFNMRFFRPYPPGRLKVNGARWHAGATINDATPALTITWAHRDRVLQADQLVGHDDDSIGPEPGVTCTMRVYNPTTNTVVRTEVGLRGDSFAYQRGQALFDQGYPAAPVTSYFSFTSEREGFEAWQGYLCDFTVTPTPTIPSNYLAFDQRVIETPYVLNMRDGVPNVDGNYTTGMAARPADRMADTYDLLADDTIVDSGDKFTPWIISDFRLPELETTINVRTSSLYDGVSIKTVTAGQLALIDNELVEVVSVSPTQIVIARGCGDTIPAVHLAGARVWFLDVARSIDKTPRAEGASVAMKMRPFVYGPPVDAGMLPVQQAAFTGRALRPYPPGRMVVNGRPWFETAVSISGGSVLFSWARRDRFTIGGDVVDHSEADMLPEPDQITRLQFYYETPSMSPGSPAAFHLLRAVDAPGTSYAYPYASALLDGDEAGRALGVCGTVVIFCRIFSVRAGIESLQSYVASVRVPSYPCVAP